MYNKEKPKSLIVCDKINILAQADARTGTHVEQASWLRLSVSSRGQAYDCSSDSAAIVA
jgi:hypothetical protein